MNEDHTQNHNRLLEADFVIHESAEKMKELLRGSRPLGLSVLPFEYSDANDMVHYGNFLSDSGIDRETAVFIVTTHEGCYEVTTTKSSDSAETIGFGVKVEKYDAEAKESFEVSPDELRTLADILGQLDKSQVEDNYKDNAAQNEKHAFSWWGKVAHRR